MSAHAKRRATVVDTVAPIEPTHEAEIVVLPPRTPEATPSRGVEMDQEIAEYWELWSEQIGRALVPVLERLAGSLPRFSSAMVCTADGFNLCTLGINEEQVSRLSAMTSSMHSLADVLSAEVHQGDEPLDTVSLTNGSSQTVLMAIRGLIIGQVLLWVTAEKETLGVLLMRARVAAEDVRAILAEA